MVYAYVPRFFYIDKNLDQYKKLKKIVLAGGTVSPAFDGLELFTQDS